MQQDILALEPQFGRVPQAQQRAQQQARPVADDAEDAKPSWLVRVREGGTNEKPGPSWLCSVHAGALLLVSASSRCPAYAATLAVTQLGITS